MDKTELPEEFTIVSPLYSTEKTRTWRWGSIMTFAASAAVDNSKLIHIVGNKCKHWFVVKQSKASCKLSSSVTSHEDHVASIGQTTSKFEHRANNQ
jgi:hypothetical protein